MLQSVQCFCTVYLKLDTQYSAGKRSIARKFKKIIYSVFPFLLTLNLALAYTDKQTTKYEQLLAYLQIQNKYGRIILNVILKFTDHYFWVPKLHIQRILKPRLAKIFD